MIKLEMKLLMLFIFFLIVPIVQATDYGSLKNQYIANHPGQAIIPFPWEPTTSTKVLPFNYEIPAAPGNSFSMTACRNEFEPASFIINAQKDLSGINIIVPNLYDTHGNSIPSSAIDVRLVKPWYQAVNALYPVKLAGATKTLVPELLLKDDTLVKVDYVTNTNYLKVTINGVQQYIDISSPTAYVPQTAQFSDATTLQPFSLKANENKQIWITVHVPSTTPAGNYSGNITITTPSETPVTMNLSVTILPFDLEPAPVDYGLYYVAELTGETSYYKTATQYKIELQNMKEHGVLYPSLFQENDANLDKALTIRDTVGLPKDKIYVYAVNTWQDAYIGNPTDPAGLATIANKVTNYRNHTESFRYQNTYFYGIDERSGAEVTAQRPAWTAVHNAGGKIWAAGYGDLGNLAGDLIDTGVIAGVYPYTTLDTTQLTLWHGHGHKAYVYNFPQVGVENPEIYRKNFGYTLWNAGYDGAMDFAYQYKDCDTWNDFNGDYYKDHNFAYPTSNGVIDTIQWEGFREGVDDTRYVASLIKKEGSITSAKTIVSSSLSQGDNMTTTRKKVIERIKITSLLKISAFWIPENLDRDVFWYHFTI